jgi:hypothetical protein
MTASPFIFVSAPGRLQSTFALVVTGLYARSWCPRLDRRVIYFSGIVAAPAVFAWFILPSQGARLLGAVLVALAMILLLTYQIAAPDPGRARDGWVGRLTLPDEPDPAGG